MIPDAIVCEMSFRDQRIAAEVDLHHFENEYHGTNGARLEVSYRGDMRRNLSSEAVDLAYEYVRPLTNDEMLALDKCEDVLEYNLTRIRRTR